MDMVNVGAVGASLVSHQAEGKMMNIPATEQQIA
jgi:hypothetical protein